MTPPLSAAKRGSGQSLALVSDTDRPPEDGRPWRVRCVLCERVTWAETFRAAQNQADTHQRLHHEAAS